MPRRSTRRESPASRKRYEVDVTLSEAERDLLLVHADLTPLVRTALESATLGDAGEAAFSWPWYLAQVLANGSWAAAHRVENEFSRRTLLRLTERVDASIRSVPLEAVKPHGILVLRLKITVKGVQPPFWRRVLVPGRWTLDQLDPVIRSVTGWGGAHRHTFEYPYLLSDSDDRWETLRADNSIDESTSLRQALPHAKARIIYIYGPAGEWVHDVMCEAEEYHPSADGLPECRAGRMACPPVDCGGPDAYANLRCALTSQTHSRHLYAVAVLGESFDAAAFDLGAAQARVAALCPGTGSAQAALQQVPFESAEVDRRLLMSSAVRAGLAYREGTPLMLKEVLAAIRDMRRLRLHPDGAPTRVALCELLDRCPSLRACISQMSAGDPDGAPPSDGDATIAMLYLLEDAGCVASDRGQCMVTPDGDRLLRESEYGELVCRFLQAQLRACMEGIGHDFCVDVLQAVALRGDDWFRLDDVRPGLDVTSSLSEPDADSDLASALVSLASFGLLDLRPVDGNDVLRSEWCKTPLFDAFLRAEPLPGDLPR